MRHLHAIIVGISIAILWISYVSNMESSYKYHLIDKVLYKEPVMHTEDKFINRAWKVEYHLVSQNRQRTIIRYYSDYYLADTFEPDFSSYSSPNIGFAIHIAFLSLYMILFSDFFIITVFDL